MQALVNVAAKFYQRAVHKELAKYGLRYEDVLMAEHPDYREALKYLPEEEVQARTRRIRRAQDLSLKHEYLPKEVQAVQEPGKFYMADMMEEMRRLREERERLNNF